jgi:hypothetical protein
MTRYKRNGGQGWPPEARNGSAGSADSTPAPAWQQGIPLVLIVAVQLWRVARPREALPRWLQVWLARCWRAAA